VAGPVQATATSSENRSRQSDGTELTESSGSGGTRIVPVDVTLKPVAETAQQTLERITLRKDEVEMIEALSPFLGKSPRALKRFMNIYRLIRGLHRGTDLDAFLDGADGKPATYPAVQFWLAVDIGLTSEEENTLKETVAALNLNRTPLKRFLSNFEEDLIPNAPADPRDTRAVFLETIAELKRPGHLLSAEDRLLAFKEVVQRLPGAEGTRTLYEAHAAAGRFTLRHS
jgi:hypothetical protein